MKIAANKENHDDLWLKPNTGVKIIDLEMLNKSNTNLWPRQASRIISEKRKSVHNYKTFSNNI